ncbi:hypothetical protein Tco_1288052 [Tanacetum coccineum]
MLLKFLKKDGKEVDVHMYRLMIGSLMYLTSSRPDIMFAVCACARYKVNLKVSHLYAVKKIFKYLKGQPKLGLWYLKDSLFDLVAYTDSDYAGVSLDRKSTTGGCQFLGCILISWQCKKQTVVANSTTEAEYVAALKQFWSAVKAKTINGEVQLHALVDGKKIIVTESTVRRELQLEDVKGIDCLPNSIIFEELTRMSAKTTAWNEFSSTMASAIICLATNQKFNFSKYIFENMVRNLDNLSGKFLMYPRRHKDSQANEIASLKRRVKKLKQKKRSRTHGLKRLYKVGLTARVESSGDEEDLGEDASKQGGRINAIDADEDITLVSVQDDADKEMFDVDTLNGEEVFVAGQNENVVEEIVDVAQVSTAATNVTITTEEITLAQALADLKSTKPKAKGIAFREPGESTTIFSQQLQDKGLSQDKGKGILVEPEKPLKKKDQLKLDEEIALKLQAEIDEEERIARAKEEKIDEANIAWDDIQAKVDADYQLAERLQAEEHEQFIIEEKATFFKELLEQRRKHFAAKRAEEKRNKPPTKTQHKKIMITYLKNMEG